MVTNWAGNVVYASSDVRTPRTVAELQQLVAQADRVRALGTGHSFNRIADTTGTLVSLADLPIVAEADSATGMLRVSGALRYGDLVPALRAVGRALPNTGSLPHISVAGAAATATHGSGVGNRVLADQIRSLTLVTASGDLVTVDRRTRPDDFEGFPVSLGRLGIAVELELALVDDFEIAQTVVDDVDAELVGGNLLAVLGSAYSVSIFTRWSAESAPQVWVKELVGAGARWSGEPLWGGRLADGPRHPLPGMSVEHTTRQMGEPGPWAERLPHFRFDALPSSGDELQSEYFVAATHAGAVWRELRDLGEVLAPVLQVSEVRAVAPDALWLSPTRGEPTVAFHFTWIRDEAAVRPVVEKLEERLTPFDARPHWGKVFATSPERLAGLFPALPRFRSLVDELDPTGKLGNDRVDAWLGLL